MLWTVEKEQSGKNQQVPVVTEERHQRNEMTVKKDSQKEKELIIENIADLKIRNKFKRHTSENKAYHQRDNQRYLFVSPCNVPTKEPENQKNNKKVVKIPEMAHISSAEQIPEEKIPPGRIP